MYVCSVIQGPSTAGTHKARLFLPTKTFVLRSVVILPASHGVPVEVLASWDEAPVAAEEEEDEVVAGSGTKGSVCVACAVPLVAYSAVILVSPLATSNMLIVRLNRASEASGW